MPTASQSSLLQDLLAYVDASPTPYHAVAETERRLVSAGFTRWDERDAWAVRPGGRHFVVRSGGSLIAFIVGEAPPAETGFRLIGAHTDSPGLRVKPCPARTREGHVQLGVEVYGSPLFSTWLDRDLSLAGRVVLRDGSTRLVDFRRVIARIPNLAIHLNRAVNQEGLQLNPQQHLVPCLGMELDGAAPALQRLLEAQLGEQAEPVPGGTEVLGFDLAFYDTQRASVGGLGGEYLFSGRLDNLVSCHAALGALLGSGNERWTRVIACFDHEEVGSRSESGAQGQFLLSVLTRLAEGFSAGGSESLARAVTRSLLVSVDMAHAVHPNYPDKHDGEHRPRLNGGPVLKLNAGRAYGTDAIGHAVFRQACDLAGFAPQYFVSRNDLPCGSTIGSLAAALTGIRAVDVGSPLLSMHSAREMGGTEDVPRLISALAAFFALPSLPDPSS